MKKIAASLLLLFVSNYALATSFKPEVIYGDDGRQDVYQVSRADIREIADSTVAMIPRNLLSKAVKGMVTLTTESYGSSLGLCTDEPYYTQPTIAECTGSLIGDDLILTAGHCISASDCKDYAFAFEFKMTDEKTAPRELPAKEIYNCKSIVAHEYYSNRDYSVVKLDRPVKDHRILSLAQNSILKGQDVYVIGHPSGLPTKVASGAQVRRAENEYFVTNLDTYAGNSGSPVFSMQTNEIVGVLVRGANDFVFDKVQRCQRSNVCADDACRGEEVTDISLVTKALRP